ncbi:MAG: hypothetical protein U5L74_09975 [Ideonella sp.]|nr:hypothetical protein [Ideonella sp.]
MNTIPAISNTDFLASAPAASQPQELSVADLRAVSGGASLEAGESVDSPFRGWSDGRDSSPFRGW